MKIGWFIYGNRSVAGARIQGLNMHEYFISKNIDSKIIYASKGYDTSFNFSKKEIDDFLKDHYDLIVVHKFQKGEYFNYFVKQAHQKGIKIVYIGLDEINIDFATACDAIIVVSRQLKSEIPKKYQKRVYMVFDGYEHDAKKFKIHSNKKKITLVFVSNNLGYKFPQIEYLPDDISLTVISHSFEKLRKLNEKGIIKYALPYPGTAFKFKYLSWDINTIENEILKCDVAVIPYVDEDLKKMYVKRKSSNRLVLFMSLGLPTIVSPTDEFQPLIIQGKNGFIAKTSKEWIKYIGYLRDHPEVRVRIGKRARSDVVPKYSKESQGELYLKIFKKILKK